jgi:hypothetical protein
MMKIIASNRPTIIVGVLMVVGFILQNRGVLTADQVNLVLLAVGLGGTRVAHGMTRP